MQGPQHAPQPCKGHQPDGSPCTNVAWADGYCAACFVTQNQEAQRVSGGGELHHTQVRRCNYQWMPSNTASSRMVEWKPCNVAILAPATLCHRHGGSIETDLGRVYAEAIHAVQTGRLTLPHPDWWKTPQRRWESLGGRGVAMFAAYPDAWAETWTLMPERWLRLGDRVAALAHYVAQALDQQYDEEELVGHVLARSAQPHFSPRQWNALGRQPSSDAIGLPTTRKVLTEAVALDPEWTERQAWAATATSPGRSVPVLLFAADETEGGPFRPIAPLPPGRPATQLTIDEFEARLHGAARSRRWTLDVGITRPGHGVAHFDRERQVATVAHGIGDRHTRLWALAHTAGHIALGHRDCGDETRLPFEAEAEAFAVLAMHRAGIFSESTAAVWRATYPVDLGMLAFDRLRAAAAAVSWLI